MSDQKKLPKEEKRMSPMGLVYASPEYMKGPIKQGMGMFPSAQNPQQAPYPGNFAQQDEEKRFCESCGCAVKAGVKFCPECSALLPAEK